MHAPAWFLRTVLPLSVGAAAAATGLALLRPALALLVQVGAAP